MSKKDKKNKIFGYARISTRKQSLERQIKNILKAYPEAIIVDEQFTGTSSDRPKFNSLIKNVKESDVIIFDSVSRMSRNANEGVKIYMELYDRGVNLVFLKEPHINTQSYKEALKRTNELKSTNNEIADTFIEATKKVMKILAIQQIEQAFEQSEKEVLDLQKRTQETLELIKANGKKIGRPKGCTIETKKSKEVKKIIKKYSKAFNGDMKDNDIIDMIKGRYNGKCDRNTYYKYKKEVAEELEAEKQAKKKKKKK